MLLHFELLVSHCYFIGTMVKTIVGWICGSYFIVTVYFPHVVCDNNSKFFQN
jgi:hypothetical protein